MKKIFIVLLLLFSFQGFADTLYVGETCPHCKEVESFMEENNITNIEIKETWNDSENRKIFISESRKVGINENFIGAVPTLILDESYEEKEYIIGDKPIISYLKTKNITQKDPNEEFISEDTLQEIFDDNGNKVEMEEGKENNEEKNIKSHISIWSILIGSASVDSINPCAFAVMFILISSFLYTSKDRKKTVFIGIGFILAIFLSYFLFGIGILKISQVGFLMKWVQIFAATLSIFLGLLHIKDIFFYKPGNPGVEIPTGWRPKMKKVLTEVQSPFGAFVAGLFVSWVLLPCSSGPLVIFTTFLAGEGVDRIWETLYIFIYCIVFILPMFGILLLAIGSQNKLQMVSEYKENYIHLIHGFIGTILLVLGGYIFFILF